MIKKMKKKRGKLQFSFFLKIFAPLETKMMKNDQKMKKPEENCNFPFFGKSFAPLEAKMMKHDKQMIKKCKKKM